MGYLDLISQGYVPEKIWAPQSWKRKQEEGAARRERIAARREPERQIKAAKAAVSNQNREVLFPNTTIQAKPSTLKVKEAARKTLITGNPLIQRFPNKTLDKLGTLDTRSGLQKKFDLLSQIKKWESAPKNFVLDTGTDLGRISIGGLNSIIKNPYANSYFGSSDSGNIGTYHAADEEERNTFRNINQFMKDREEQQRRQAHDYAIQRKQKEIAAIKSSLGPPELLNQTVSIPITNKKSVTVKYGDAVVIDNFIDNTETDGKFWDRITSLIDALGLSEEEKKQAESYAGLRLLAKANTSNGQWSAGKEFFAPAAKFVQGLQDSAAATKEFFFDMGLGFDKEYAKKKAEEIKFYEENPDQLGLDLYNSNLNGYESNYLAQTKIDNLLGWTKDTTPLTRAISEYGMRSAGQMLGAYGTAYLAGIPQAITSTGAALRVTPAVAAVTNSKIGSAAAKALSKTPAIPKVASKGIASSAINKGIGAFNKLSAKNVVSFLNPLDNPTTAIMGANAYQDKYVDLLRAGYDENTAQKNALFTGYVNTITEKMGYDGKPGNFFKKSGDVVSGSMKQSLLKNTGNVLLKTYLPNTISEGIEEVYATVFERLGDYVSQVGYLGEDGEYHERPIAGDEGVLDPKAMGESFLGGLIGGAVMGSVGVISDIANMSIGTAKANHQDIQKATDSIRKHMEKTMKKNGIDNISIPEAPDFQNASVSEISQYYESMVDCYKKILGDNRVIEHDNKLLNKIGKFYSDSESVDALIESGLESPENTPSRKLAEQLKEKREKNQKITVREIGELQRENAIQIAGEEQLTRQANAEATVDGRTTQEVATNQNASNSQDKSTGVKAGEVTTIYSPYEGEKPVQTGSVDNTPIPVPQESVQNAASAVEQAKNNKEGVSLRSALRKMYERLFDKSGGTKHIPVKNMTFRNEPYVVDVNKNAISKIISDKNLTVEKLSLLDNLNAIIENGKYVGSGNYVQKGNKKKLTIRFDYFETPVRINGKDYIAAFDVEVFPNTNQYRTHKVIEKMDLIALPDADTGPVPAANGNASSPTTSIPQNSENVNGSLGNGAGQTNNQAGVNTGETSTFMGEIRDIESSARPVELLDTDSQPVRAAKQVMLVLSQRYGVNCKTYRGDPAINGYYDPKTRTLYINENSSEPMLCTVSHEFLHSFKDTDAEGYQLLKDVVASDLNLVQFNEYKKALLQTYDELGIDYKNLSNDEINDLVLEEAMSDLMTEVMRDPVTIERIATENRSLAQKIIDGLSKIIEEIKQAIQTYFGRGNREFQELVYHFEQVKAVYQEVLAGSDGRVQSTDGRPRYSVKYESGTPVVIIEENIFAGHKGEKPHKVIRDYIRNHYSGDFARIIESGQKVYFGKDLPGEYTQSRNTRNLTRRELRAKNQAAQNLNELVENGINRRWNKNVKEKHAVDAKYGWYKYSTRFQVNGKIYDADLLIRNDADGRKYLYDVLDPTEEGRASLSSSNPMGSDVPASTRPSDINNISQNQDSVNSSISENGQNDTEKFLVDLESGERGSVVRRKDKAEEAMRKYEETGDPNDLPEQQWANAYYRDAQRRDTFLNNQIDTAEYELENAKTKERREHLQALIDNLRDKQMAAKENLATSKAVVEMVESIATPRNFDLAEIADQLHGIDTNTIKNGNYRFNDIYRNMKRVFKKNFRVVEPLLDQFDAAKGDYARDTVSILAEMNQFIQKQLKIKKGSKESKAVQWIAEGERNPNVRRNKDREALRKMGITDLKNLDPNVRIPYTEQMLVEEFGTKRAEDIKEAAQWFRGKYDELIDEINRTQRLIYPNRPDKLIPKRKDYMRHFREVSEGLAGLRNILDMDNNIDPILVGTSEYTKPKEKWASIKQKRSGKATQEGAIEGFLDYIGQAEYAIHINPYIDRFRGLARDLAQIKSEKNDTSLNGFIGYLNDYAADLAGKSSKLDRAVIDSLGARGRTMMKGLRWFNNRTKANAVLGNLGSVAKQVMNLPNGMALLENPANMIPGIVDVFRGFRDGGKIQEQYKKSNFLTERLKLDRAFGKFDKMGPGKVAQNLLGIADEFGTRVIWNAAYREGVNLQKSRDITDAVKYADNLTRQAVAGRGIGETPLAYKSEMGRLFLPFQIEVNNTWNVLRDVLQTSRYDGKLKTVKNFGDKALRVLLFYLVTWGLNEAMEKLTGSKGSFDPLGDIIDGIFQGAEELPEKSKLEQWQRGGLRAAQNLAGDFIGSRSFGWVASSFMDAVNDDWATKFFNDSIYPSQGVNVPALQSVQKGVKKFGDGDPVGSAAEFATSFLTPWGGKQLDKTIRGLGDYLRGGNYQNNIYKEFSTGKRGDLYYPIEQTPANAIQSAVFGPSSLGENAAYWQTKRLETYAKQAEREFKEDAAEQFTKQVKESNLSTVIKQFYTDETVEPKTASTKVKYKDTEYTLTEKERQQYQETIDREALKLVTELSKSNGFSKLSEEDKVKQLEAAQSYADAVAKNEVLKKKEPGKTIQFFKQDVDNRKKYYSIWDEVEPEDEDKQARRKAINEVSSVVNALSKKSKLTPGVISGLNQYMDKIESRAANAVDKELNRLGLLREENTDTTGDMDVTSSTMGMFEYTDDGQKYEVKVNYADIPKIMQEVEEETYKQMQRLLNNQYRSQKKKTYGQRYNYKNANADQKIKWVNEVRTDVRSYYKDKYARKYGVRKVPNKLKGVR